MVYFGLVRGLMFFCWGGDIRGGLSVAGELKCWRCFFKFFVISGVIKVDRVRFAYGDVGPLIVCFCLVFGLLI